ncbi:MAG: OmpA family protein [Terriglobales bacterium]
MRSRKPQLYGWIAVVVLAGLCSLPAAAQTAATNPAQQTSQTEATAPATATQKPPLQPQIRQGFWGRLNPFARKKYVQNQLAPVRDRVNEVSGLTDGNAKSIADLDAETKAGIAQASQQAQQANDAADAATQQVQQTSSKADQLNQQVASVNTKVQGVDQYRVTQQAVLHFKRGPSGLNPATEQQLDGFLQNLSSDKGYVVEVVAYSTRKGRAGDAASMDLANTVVRYLVLQHNVPLYRIFTMGMGNASPATAQMGEAASSRVTAGGTVEIKILENSLAASSTSANSGS